MSIKTLQTEYKKLAHKLDWECDVKSWDWDNLLANIPKTKMSLADVKAGVVLYGNDININIDELKNCSEIIQKRISGILVSQDKNSKIDLLQRAKSKTDIVVNVLANTEIILDFSNNIFQYWANLYFIIGAGSRVTILDKHNLKKSKFGAGSVNIILNKNSQVDYSIDTDDKTNYHMNYNFTCAESAVARVFVKNNSKAKHQYHSININHPKNNSHGEITWLVDAQKSSNSVFHLANNHTGRDTTADMVIKTLGRGKSRIKIDGLINIGKKAKNTNSYLKEDVLLVSEDANIKAIPNLEILNNDVNASHGATLGQVDEKQILYLQSRGLSCVEAENIITASFMKSALSRIKDRFLLQYFSSKF